jgi:hypothetical protein
MKKNIILISSLFIIWIISIWFNIYNINREKIINSEAKHIADFTDNRKISWFADNIFVWKVIENLWVAPKEEWGTNITNTLFNVHVLYNIKWIINWDIIIRQTWWYDEYWNLHVLDWTELIEQNWIYLLSTRWNSFKITSHQNGSHLLSDNGDLSNDEIRDLILWSQIINDFRQAYKNEIYYEWDIKISSEVNAYKNLSTEEKENLENIESGFIEF